MGWMHLLDFVLFCRRKTTLVTSCSFSAYLGPSQKEKKKKKKKKKKKSLLKGKKKKKKNPNGRNPFFQETKQFWHSCLPVGCVFSAFKGWVNPINALNDLQFVNKMSRAQYFLQHCMCPQRRQIGAGWSQSSLSAWRRFRSNGYPQGALRRLWSDCANV